MREINVTKALPVILSTGHKALVYLDLKSPLPDHASDLPWIPEQVVLTNCTKFLSKKIEKT